MTSSVSEEFLSSLRELTFSNRPQIDMLTMLAEDYYADADSIAFTIENHLAHVQGDKLPTLYLVDNIVKKKKIGRVYMELFSRNLPSFFTRVFAKSDLKTRSSLYKLRVTWDSVFPAEKLHELDTLVNNIDPNWPVSRPPGPPVVQRPCNIHINPNFIKTADGGDIREEILRKKKVLLELQKKKVELELLQTQEVLEKEQKKLESFTTIIRGENKPPAPGGAMDRVQAQVPGGARAPDPDNTKKLLEVSMRDPRRRTRQADTTGSPASGTSSPRPGSAVSEGSPYYSDDSRDRPPKKKYRVKDKKKSREDPERDHKKSYRPRLPQGAADNKRDNGHSYKPSSATQDSCLDVVDMEIVPTEDVEPSQVDRSLKPGDAVLPVVPNSFLPTSLSISAPGKSIDSPTRDEPKTKPAPSRSLSGKESSRKSKVKNSDDSPDKRHSLDSDKNLKSREVTASADSVMDRIRGVTDIHPEKVTDKGPSHSVGATSTPDPVSIRPGSDPIDSSDTASNRIEPDRRNTTIIGTALEKVATPDAVLDSMSRDSFQGVDVPLLVEAPAERDESSQSRGPSTKRKLDSEEEFEKNKKMLLANLTEEGEGSPSSIDSLEDLSDSRAGREVTGVPPPSAPPPPSIPPLIEQKEKSPSPDSEIYDPELHEPEDTPRDSPEPTVPSTLLEQEESGKDVDLRLLLPRPPVERAKEESAMDKPVAAELDLLTPLFGGEDVDYRQKPPSADFNLPSPPPPPVIGNLQEAAASKKSWAQIKDRGDRASKERSPQTKPDRSKRTSISSGKQPVASLHRASSHQDSEDHCHLLAGVAEEQLRNGTITFPEYNAMLHGISSINEERILRETKARYSDLTREYLDRSSPSPTMEVDPKEAERLGKSPDKSRLVETREDPGTDRTPDTRPSAADEESLYDRDRPDYADRSSDGVHADRGRQYPSGPAAVQDNFVRQQQQPPQINAQMPMLPQYITPNAPYQMNMRSRAPRDVIPPTILPKVSMDLLMETERERLDTIFIGGQDQQVRFYDKTAVVLLSWDNPREVRFPTEKRVLYVDQRLEFVLQFGDSPIEIKIDGMVSSVQLGAPTRELYVDDKFYTLLFGGPPVEVLLCGRVRSVCLGGPVPVVQYGLVKRTDLVAGVVTLIVNAKSMFPLFLDAKPQKFHIEGEPCVLQFADSLVTVLINRAVVPLEFGGCPVPVVLRGTKGGAISYLRLTFLPNGIVPGQIPIWNMESFAYPPPIMMRPPPSMLGVGPPPGMMAPPPVDPSIPVPGFLPPPVPTMPPIMPPVSIQNVDLVNPPAVLPNPQPVQTFTAEPTGVQNPEPPSTREPSSLNINDLFQKLVKTGLLRTEPPKVKTTPAPEPDVDFSKPETLKAPRPAIVAKLYSGVQCGACGIRFPPEVTKMYSRHLDWHFRQNRREKTSTKKPQCRGWYYDYGNWLQYQELDDSDDKEPPGVGDKEEEEKEGEGEEEPPSVAVGSRKDATCQLCEERFEEFFDHDTEEWQARNAVTGEGDLLYHPLCHQEHKARTERNKDVAEEPEEEEMEEEETEEPPPVIDLDDTEVPSPPSSPAPPQTDSLPLLGPQLSPDVIAVEDDDEPSPALDEDPPQTEETAEAPSPEPESDDDIIEIKPIERKIESVDLLDEEEEEEEEGATAEEGAKEDEEEEEETGPPTVDVDDEDSDSVQFDFSKVKVKQEKDRERVAVDNVDPTYTATIDGNIVHQVGAVMGGPRQRIRINIHSSGARAAPVDHDHHHDRDSLLASEQPPPPGEEDPPPPRGDLKPSLRGVRFSDQPLVDQGYELSGLCTIM